MSVSKSLQKARSLSRKGDLPAAVKLYLEVLDNFPKNRDAKRELRTLSASPKPTSPGAAAAVAAFRDHISKGEFKPLLSKAKTTLRSYPNDAELHNLTGVALANHGQYQAANSCYTSALKLHPAYAFALYNSGVALQRSGQPNESVKTLKRAQTLGMDDADLHGNLGLSLAGAGQPEEAVVSYRRALNLGGDRVALLNNLGNALLETGRIDEAEANYLEALDEDSGYAKTHSHLCELYEKQMRLDDLAKAVERANATCGSDHPEILYRAAQLASHRGQFPVAYEALNAIASDRLPASLVAPFFELRGKTCDRLGHFTQAYAAFQGMNDHVARSQPESADLAIVFSEGLGSLRRAWDAQPAATASIPSGLPDHRRLAFLVGFPRSGTTLLDTLLRGHPDVAVVEEKPMAGAMALALGTAQTPDALRNMSDARILELREVYEAELTHHLPKEREGAIVVDKLPLNLSNAALIHRVFPEARFILSLRHPCDCVLSCFMQNFRLNGAMANCLTLDGGARLYDNVLGLWQKLRDALGLDVTEVRYEDLIRDVGATCRPVIEALGVAWTDDLLDHRATARKRGAVRTPSYSQVSQPLYSRADGRWRNYRTELEPSLPVLAPWIETLGYEA